MTDFDASQLPIQVLSILPNPILVKNDALEYVWVKTTRSRRAHQLRPKRSQLSLDGGSLNRDHVATLPLL